MHTIMVVHHHFVAVESCCAVLTAWCWQGGIGPMQGQAAHFVKFAPEKIEYGIKRYTNETKRLYGVIEKALSDGRQWLAAGEYTIADIANFSWMFVHQMAGMVLHLENLNHSLYNN